MRVCRQALAVLLVYGMGLGCASAVKSPPPTPPATKAAAPTTTKYEPSPAVGQTDLSMCHKPRPDYRDTTTVDVREFARRLHGTWRLNTRTIQGLTIPTNSTFYFDIDLARGTPTRVTGTAMMLDFGNLGVLDTRALTQECPKDARMSAFWDVTVELSRTEQRVSLKLDGEYIGSYGEFAKGMRATEAMAFLKKDDAYLSGGLATPNGGMGEDVWDRISLMGGVLTYLSCANAYIERYIKQSDEQPQIDTLSLKEMWEQKKKTGELLDPTYGRRRL